MTVKGKLKQGIEALLKEDQFPKLRESESTENLLKELQLKMLRTQQGIWHQKKRAILVFEGFDAAGKGGAIHRLVESMDPRGFRVHPIGPPEKEDQAKHYLYRFWQNLPAPGTIAIFDRSWYGRVLVEKVDKLISDERAEQAYEEIRQFEKMLTNDGVELIKVFLVISKEEQLRRFEDRLEDPYKQWKISMEDVKARKHWDQYVLASDQLLAETSTKNAPWKLIPANDKDYTRIEVLQHVTDQLAESRQWIEKKSRRSEAASLKKVLKELGVKKLS